MKIYRCVIACLMVFFIIVGVWYVVSCYNEQRSIEDGILVWNVEEVSDENTWNKMDMGREIACHR